MMLAMVAETRPKLILIVEDEDRSRRMLRHVLEFHGYRTIEAGSGELAVQRALDDLPDLILMDIRLPGISGIEALRMLRADPRTANIPVIAVTASVVRGDEPRFLAEGFNGYIPKPIDVVTFASAVRSQLSQSGG
jgi:two-component system, cell cycle response regulator DivK